MYDESSAQFPEALPQQNPTSKRRDTTPLVERLARGSKHIDQRFAERGYTLPQVLQTYAYGHQIPDPAGEAGVSHYYLNSIDHANLRRRIVVHDAQHFIKTTLPREEIPEPEVKPAAKPSTTKSRRREQLAKKRLRTAQA